MWHYVYGMKEAASSFLQHQELESIIQVVAACGIWCFGLQVVGMVWS